MGGGKKCLWAGLCDFTESGEGMSQGIPLEEVGYKHLIGRQSCARSHAESSGGGTGQCICAHSLCAEWHAKSSIQREGSEEQGQDGCLCVCAGGMEGCAAGYVSGRTALRICEHMRR